MRTLLFLLMAAAGCASTRVVAYADGACSVEQITVLRQADVTAHCRDGALTVAADHREISPGLEALGSGLVGALLGVALP